VGTSETSPWVPNSWHTGTAYILLTMTRANANNGSRIKRAAVPGMLLAVRFFGARLLTVRIDLES